ncbi:MAG TPA: ATP-binding protein [Pirellulales bacterium]|nr:ATP-binding protein [Pirellulales bacterium]
MIAPIVVVSVLWIGLNISTTYYLGWQSRRQARALTNSVARIGAALSIQQANWRIEQSVVVAGKTEGPAVASSLAECRRALAELDAASLAPRELEATAAIQSSFERLVALVESPSADAALPVAVTPAAAELSDACRTFVRLEHALTIEAMQERVALDQQISAIRLVVIVVGPALGIALGYLAARGLHRHLTRISVTLSDARGELDQEIGRVEIDPVGAAGDLPRLQEQVRQVAERIRLAIERLQRSRQETVRAARLAAVGELAAGVAHEIRNPLTAVKLLIQSWAEHDPAQALDERQMRVVLDEIQRIEVTIERLLDFARPPTLERCRHDLRQPVRGAMELVAGRARRGGVTIDDRLGAAPCSVDADAGQLRQVVVNLLLNAIEAIPDGGTIEVGSELVVGPPAQCVVTIADSGPGIADKVRARLFEPFVTNKERGTGLGLAISRRIVQEHGGELSARNRPGGGAEFRIALPQAASPDVSDHADQPIPVTCSP